MKVFSVLTHKATKYSTTFFSKPPTYFKWTSYLNFLKHKIFKFHFKHLSFPQIFLKQCYIVFHFRMFTFDSNNQPIRLFWEFEMRFFLEQSLITFKTLYFTHRHLLWDSIPYHIWWLYSTLDCLYHDENLMKRSFDYSFKHCYQQLCTNSVVLCAHRVHLIEEIKIVSVAAW